MRLVHDSSGLKAMYQACMEAECLSDRLKVTETEFLEICKMKGFDVYTFIDVDPVGCVFMDGNKVHVSILKKFQGKCGIQMVAFIRAMLKTHGHLVAEIQKDNLKAQGFIERLGFTEVHQKDGLNIYHV